MKKHILILLGVILLGIQGYAQIPSYIDTNGLTAWYPFTGNANDYSGHGFTGAISGATLTKDRFGHDSSAYFFNGTSNYIYSAAAFTTGSSDKSFSVWFKSNTIKRGWMIAGGTDNSAEAFGLYIANTAGNIYFQGMGAYDVNLSYINDTNWHNCIVVYTVDTVKAYIDGTLIASQHDVLNTVGTSIIFGRRQNPALESGFDAYFSGTLDDIGIWSRALTQTEIIKLFYSCTDAIIANPTNDTAITGNLATFTITDTIAASYQWQQNSGTGFVNLSNAGPYSGVTTKNLTINPVTITMNNYLYRCIRNDSSLCSDTSSIATLVVNPSCSYIVNQPINDTVNSGGTAIFSITDTAMATYQWQQNSGTGFVNLSNAGPYNGVTTKTLTINPITTSMNNYLYRCLRSDSSTCLDTSITATLVVHPSTGINYLTKEEITVSPNPANNTISIGSPAAIEKIEIVNLLGQTLLLQKTNKNFVDIDIHNLVPGIYILKVNDTYVTRLVKE